MWHMRSLSGPGLVNMAYESPASPMPGNAVHERPFDSWAR